MIELLKDSGAIDSSTLNAAKVNHHNSLLLIGRFICANIVYLL